MSYQSTESSQKISTDEIDVITIFSIFLDNINNLIKLIDNDYAVMVCKHPEYIPKSKFKMEGQVELCTKICTIATVLHQVHPGEDRGAQRMIFTCNTHHIYIKLHQSAPISLYLRD